MRIFMILLISIFPSLLQAGRVSIPPAPPAISPATVQGAPIQPPAVPDSTPTAPAPTDSKKNAIIGGVSAAGIGIIGLGGLAYYLSSQKPAKEEKPETGEDESKPEVKNDGKAEIEDTAPKSPEEQALRTYLQKMSQPANKGKPKILVVGTHHGLSEYPDNYFTLDINGKPDLQADFHLPMKDDPKYQAYKDVFDAVVFENLDDTALLPDGKTLQDFKSFKGMPGFENAHFLLKNGGKLIMNEAGYTPLYENPKGKRKFLAHHEAYDIFELPESNVLQKFGVELLDSRIKPTNMEEQKNAVKLEAKEKVREFEKQYISEMFKGSGFTWQGMEKAADSQWWIRDKSPRKVSHGDAYDRHVETIDGKRFERIPSLYLHVAVKD